MNAHGNQSAPALADPQSGESAPPHLSGYVSPGPTGYMNGSPSTNHGKTSRSLSPLTNVHLPLIQALHPVYKVTKKLIDIIIPNPDIRFSLSLLPSYSKESYSTSTSVSPFAIQ